jgi:hypothetical protein
VLQLQQLLLEHPVDSFRTYDWTTGIDGPIVGGQQKWARLVSRRRRHESRSVPQTRRLRPLRVIKAVDQEVGRMGKAVCAAQMGGQVGAKHRQRVLRPRCAPRPCS